MESKIIVHVTPAQVAAAKLRLKMDEKRGREHDPSVVKIANARPATVQEIATRAAEHWKAALELLAKDD